MNWKDYQKRYLWGLAAVSGVAAVVAMSAQHPNRLLAGMGAATAGAAAYALVRSDETKQVASYAAANYLVGELKDMTTSLFSKPRALPAPTAEP